METKTEPEKTIDYFVYSTLLNHPERIQALWDIGYFDDELKNGKYEVFVRDNKPHDPSFISIQQLRDQKKILGARFGRRKEDHLMLE